MTGLIALTIWLFGGHGRADVRGDGPLPVGREAGAPDGTNDPEAAAKDDDGKPISNAKRNLWINETALATALNVSYMAEQIALFGIVVGIPLLLTGIGLIILAYAVFSRRDPGEAAAA